MTINYATPPSGSVQALAQGIHIAAGHADINLAEKIGRAVNSPADHQPHEVYFIGLSDIASGKGKESLKSTGWRYLFELSNGVLHSAEVSLKESDNHEFSELNMGPFPKASIDMLKTLENDPTIAKSNYTVSAIRIPALYVFALWLKADNDQNDLIIPLNPTNLALEAGRKYDSNSFFSILQPLAKERLKSDF